MSFIVVDDSDFLQDSGFEEKNREISLGFIYKYS